MTSTTQTPTYPKYDRYKDSGVEWLGEIPEGWALVRAKRIFEPISEKGFAKEPLLSVTQSHGVIPRALLEQRVVMPLGQLESFKLVRKDDFVISLRSFQGGIEYSEYQGLVSPAYTVLRKQKKVLSQFLKFLLKSSSFISELNVSVTGIRQGKNIDFNDFSYSFLPLPPFNEQEKIARFLDQKTAAIDTAIAKKQRLIELLKEQKAILINRAVTRGLNPDVPMKDSGVEWIGEIPAHWSLKKLKFSTKIFRGKFTHRPRNDPKLYDGPYPFVQTGDVAKASKFISTYKQTLNEKGLRVSTLVPEGTVVITIAANIGDIAILGFDACFPDSVVGFKPHQLLERDYLYFMLLAMKQQFISSTTQNTQMNLNVESVGVNFITIPSKEEQRNISIYLNKKNNEIDNLIIKLGENITTIQEYKQTLIAHAVTGKVKVS